MLTIGTAGVGVGATTDAGWNFALDGAAVEDKRWRGRVRALEFKLGYRLRHRQVLNGGASQPFVVRSRRHSEVLNGGVSQPSVVRSRTQSEVPPKLH